MLLTQFRFIWWMAFHEWIPKLSPVTLTGAQEARLGCCGLMCGLRNGSPALKCVLLTHKTVTTRPSQGGRVRSGWTAGVCVELNKWTGTMMIQGLFGWFSFSLILRTWVFVLSSTSNRLALIITSCVQAGFCCFSILPKNQRFFSFSFISFFFVIFSRESIGNRSSHWILPPKSRFLFAFVGNCWACRIYCKWGFLSKKSTSWLYNFSWKSLGL